MMKQNGRIILPRIQCIDDGISQAREAIESFYDVSYLGVDELDLHPLYKATERVAPWLEMCPEVYTNETQMKPYYDYSESPFCVLKIRDEFAVDLRSRTISIDY